MTTQLQLLKRDRRIMRFYRKGNLYRDIARKCGISERTVRRRIKAIKDEHQADQVAVDKALDRVDAREAYKRALYKEGYRHGYMWGFDCGVTFEDRDCSLDIRAIKQQPNMTPDEIRQSRDWLYHQRRDIEMLRAGSRLSTLRTYRKPHRHY